MSIYNLQTATLPPAIRAEATHHTSPLIRLGAERLVPSRVVSMIHVDSSRAHAGPNREFSEELPPIGLARASSNGAEHVLVSGESGSCLSSSIHRGPRST